MDRPTRSLPPLAFAALNVPLVALLPDPGACLFALGYFAAVTVAALVTK